MKPIRIVPPLIVAIGSFSFATVGAQAPAAPPPAPKVEANLLQLMRGLLFPAANTVFAAQEDVGKIPMAAQPSTSPNPLTGTYGGWQAIENAALALAESANLLTVPGRTCSTGLLAPVERADWIKFSEDVRQAGRAAYKAAQSKNVDAMIDVSETVTQSCSGCHNTYRQARGKPRCTP